MFVLSKLLSAITQPVFWLALFWGIALAMHARWPRASVRMLWGGLFVLGGLGVEAVPNALLRPLENRYPRPPAQAVSEYAGLIVLGGAVGPAQSFTTHGQVPLNAAAERMTVPTGLMHQHPHLKLVFSGGEGRLFKTGTTESQMARAFFLEQGLNPSRMVFEDGSRTTRENAQRVKALLKQDCQQPWLLVTSAWHMPRAMAEFEALGCRVTAFPVDYRTGEHTPWNDYSLSQSLHRWEMALHEWLGQLAYALTRP